MPRPLAASADAPAVVPVPMVTVVRAVPDSANCLKKSTTFYRIVF